MEPISPEQRAASYVGRLVSKRYRLLSLIGAGGMGSVFRAQDLGGNTFAVKIMYSELLEGENAPRFEREAMLVLGLSHPHVVPTVDAGRDDELGSHFLVMPFLPGQDVDGVLEKHGALEPESAVRIALQAARGLAAAHALGIVHRDVKPGNLLLHRQGAEIVARVCDFGIAKQLGVAHGDSLTATGRQLGTPDYASPEQLRNAKTADQRTDVWGLGATLYHMLCGAPPFAHLDAVFDVIAAILDQSPPNLRERAPWVEPELAQVVHRALERDPKRRYASMTEFANALRPFSGGDEQLDDASIRAATKKSRASKHPKASKRPKSAPASAPAEPAPVRAPVADAASVKKPSKARNHAPPAKSLLPGLVLILLGVATAAASYWLTRHQ